MALRRGANHDADKGQGITKMMHKFIVAACFAATSAAAGWATVDHHENADEMASCQAMHEEMMASGDAEAAMANLTDEQRAHMEACQAMMNAEHVEEHADEHGETAETDAGDQH